MDDGGAYVPRSRRARRALYVSAPEMTALRRPSRSTAIAELRRTIDCLPSHTKRAMLEGVRRDTIIVGAYTDRDGGVCPMLAAHRRGGRTSFLAFARTWDRFTNAPSRGSRKATERELRILAHHLEASLEAADETAADVSLSAVVAEHRALRRRSARVADGVPSLADAIAEHRASQGRTALDQEHVVEELEPIEEHVVEPVRLAEPVARKSRRLPEWLHPLGSIEDYERALEQVDRQRVRLGLVGDTAGPARERETAAAGR